MPSFSYFRCFSLLLCASSWLVSLAPLSAEVTAGVEYSLSNDIRKWKMGHKFRNEGNDTTLYFLESGRPKAELEEWDAQKEVFSVQVSKHRLDLPMLLQQDYMYGFGPLEYRILEEGPEGLFAEWWTNEGPPSIHAWTRCIHRNKETVCLQYTTMDSSKVEWAKQVWEPILRNAKLKQEAK